jgi:hypothetical protein
MANGTNRRGRGRPALPAESLKRQSIGIRLRDETKAWLDARAEKNKRSISEEMQILAERARYEDEQFLPEVQAMAIQMLIAFSGGLVPGAFKDPEAFENGMVAVWRRLLGSHPEFTPTAEKRLREALNEAFSQAETNRQIKQEDATAGVAP